MKLKSYNIFINENLRSEFEDIYAEFLLSLNFSYQYQGNTTVVYLSIKPGERADITISDISDETLHLISYMKSEGNILLSLRYMDIRGDWNKLFDPNGIKIFRNLDLSDNSDRFRSLEFKFSRFEI